MSTDIAGYRAESDAPPSDVTLASILTNKAPLLNTPGSDVAEPLYYGQSNSSVNAAESQFYVAKDRIAFQNTSLTSQQNVYIPNRYFAGNTWLNIQLNGAPLTWVANNLPATAYFCMEQGWGFSCIGRLMYYLGASNVVNVAISGESNLALALISCDTQEKRWQVMQGAGKWMFSRASANAGGGNGAAGGMTLNNVGGNVLGSQLAAPAGGQLLFRNAGNVTTDAASGATIGNIYDPRFLHALVPLRLPWASLNAMQARLPFDTNLLNQPINVQIEFRRPPVRTLNAYLANAGQGTPLELLTGNAAELNIQYEQTELIDKSLSLRTDLLQNPDFNVGLPFQFLQSMTFPAPRKQLDGGQLNTDLQKFNITSMMNADLTTIFLQVQEPCNNREYGNRSDFVELNDITLELNGQQFSVYQKDNYIPMQAARQVGAIGLVHPVLVRNDADPVATQVIGNHGTACMMKEVGIYEINMSRVRALANESHLVNVPRFTNQTFQISFSIPTSITAQCFNYPAVDRAADVAYTAHLTYCYNGVFQVGGAGGASKLFTS